MDKQKVDQIFEKFSKVKALIIGDAMVDSYLWGNIDRISPEAPIPIVTVNRQESRLGGAANVSLNLQALGATPVLVSVLGDDRHGDTFIELLEKRNLSDEGIIRFSNRKTTLKTRILSGTQQIARVDEEDAHYISPEEENIVFDKVQSLVDSQDFDILIFVDYDKGIITPKLIDQICDLAKSKNILVAVDPKNRNFNDYSKVDLFKPNFKEFKEGIDQKLEKNNIDEILKAAEKIKKERQFGIIFITLAELGVLISNGVKQNHFPAEIRDIADVSGAGDTVIAVASLCLAAGLSTRLVAQLSNLAGGLVCEKSGVVPIDYDRLKREARKIKKP
ncbi:bifunctional heptose 7-phosphate kinase/heptose 1-phosphate adenyltransferase [Sunxiuqinia sp. A32]|uniref:bifunctional heptose 7-phosphate kinase/heptose 1-phosphate adenyltransferase n=1 Tax=Sunxiuqinia sp. A32 TaxID=3461496 RepID=UPI004045B467